MTYACPDWEYETDVHHLKVQRQQNRVFHATGNVKMCTSVRELHVAFKTPYVYDYKIKLCRTQAEVILNYINSHVRGI
jgi:hypothetical protein